MLLNFHENGVHSPTSVQIIPYLFHWTKIMTKRLDEACRFTHLNTLCLKRDGMSR